MKRKSIGSLHGNLAAIADHVCKTARDCMVMVWVSDCAEVYADPDEMAVFADLFTARPQTSVWRKPDGQWTEW